MEGGGAAPTFEVKAFIPEIHLKGPEATYAAIGKKKSGKSKLICRSVMWYLRDQLDTVISYVPTSRSNGDPAFFVPRAFDYDDWYPERCMSQYEFFHSLSCNKKKKHVMFIIDDCNAVVDEKGKPLNVYKSAPILKLLKEGRHHGMGLFMCGQNCLDLSSMTRTQLHMVFLFASSNEKEIEWMRSCWANGCSKKLFAAVFAACTSYKEGEPKRCLVIDTDLASAENPLAGFYVWSPPYIKTPFRCGKKDFYALSEMVWSEAKPEVMDAWAAGGKGGGSAVYGGSGRTEGQAKGGGRGPRSGGGGGAEPPGLGPTHCDDRAGGGGGCAAGGRGGVGGAGGGGGGVLHKSKKKAKDEEQAFFVSDPLYEEIQSDADAAGGFA